MIIGEKIASAGQINMQDLMKRLDEIQNPGDPAAPDTEVPDKSLASLGLDSSAAIAQLKTPIDFAKLEKNLQECVVKAHT